MGKIGIDDYVGLCICAGKESKVNFRTTLSINLVFRLIQIVAFVFGIFIYYSRPFMSEVLYIHQTFTDCMSNQHTFLYVDMPDVASSLWMVLW